jgi:MSHA pilin protein MshC
MKTRGFTLIELIMIMIVVGVLAVVAMPRFFDRHVFESRGFYDETLAALRYAQKSAVAQRRTVCVAFTAISVTLTIASAPGTSPCPANTPLTSPTGVRPFTVTAKAGVSFAPPPVDFWFSALGKASAAQNIQVNGVATIITVEQETGYVH